MKRPRIPDPELYARIQRRGKTDPPFPPYPSPARPKPKKHARPR